MVYFIQGERTGLIKIGQTKDVDSRLVNLQIGSPDRLTILAVITNEHSDGRYHTQFRNSWAFGEWFNPTPELTKFITTLPKFRTRGEYHTAPNRNVDSSATLRPANRKSTSLIDTYTKILNEFGDAACGLFAKLICQQKETYYAAIESGEDAVTNFKTALVQQVANEYRGAHAN